ncbi:MAG: DUF6265 family protein [Phycisphaerales bacterium JB040]
MAHRLIAALLMVVTTLGLAQAQIEPPAPVELTIAAARLGAVDVDQSVLFYDTHFGLREVARYDWGTAVLMDDAGKYVVITPSERKVSVAKGDCYTRINFVVPDLEAAVARLEGSGVTIDERDTSAVGAYITVRDPSGNPLNVKGPLPEEPVDSARIYNVGITVSDMAVARAFYEDVLGFEAFIEDYYPPVVPMRTGTGFMFILSDRDGERPAPYDHAADAWAGLAFETADLRSAIETLSDAGVRFCYTEPIDRDSPVWIVEFEDPFGNVHELIEHKRSDENQPEPAPTSAPADIDSIAFLEGAWRQVRPDGSVCEETWSAADDGEAASMMGMFRWTATPERGGGSRFVEIMTMREEDVGGTPTLVYRLRHFGMDLRPWEETPIVLHVVEANGTGLLMTPPAGVESDVISIAYRLEASDEGDRLHVDAVFDHGNGPSPLGFVFTRMAD